MSSPSYDWLTLESDEEILWSGEPELLGYVFVFLVGVLLIPMFGMGLVILAATYLHVTNTAYVITTESVFKKTGILSRTVTDIGHENIQDTGYRQGVTGRYFGFGTVQVSTAGGSGVEMSLAYVLDPVAVQSQLDSVATAEPRADEKTDRDEQQSVQIDGATLEELVAEMRATREALESVEQRLNDN